VVYLAAAVLMAVYVRRSPREAEPDRAAA
jgi:hypothetical protein